jgi:ribosomal protein S18 acetylase RimI-like enzyme
MKIRPYQPGDQEAVIRLWHDCGLVVSQNRPDLDIARKLDVNPEWFLVGEIDGAVIASCMAGYEGHRGWINYLAVSPPFQSKGCARRLMAAAEALLKQAGCPKINLQVRSTNRKVITFYQSLGFNIDDVVSLGKRLDDGEHTV